MQIVKSIHHSESFSVKKNTFLTSFLGKKLVLEISPKSTRATVITHMNARI